MSEEPSETALDASHSEKPALATKPAGPSCGACGAMLRREVRFCAGCGAFVGRPSAQMEVANQLPADADNDGGGLLAAGIAYLAVLGLSASLVLRDDIGLSALRSAALLIAAAGVLGVLIYHRANLRLFRLPRPPALSARTAFLGLLATVAFAVAVLLVTRLLPDAWMIDETFLHKQAGVSIWILLFDFALLPALGEEILFRGVILSGLRGAFRDRIAIVVSALLFATIHISPISFLHLALLGGGLAIVRLRTGSVWPCIVIHGVFNATLLLIAWFV